MTESMMISSNHFEQSHQRWQVFAECYESFAALMERHEGLGETPGKHLRSLENLNAQREQAWEHLRQAWRDWLAMATKTGII